MTEGIRIELGNNMVAQYAPELPETTTPSPDTDTYEGQPAPRPSHEGPLPETGSSLEIFGIFGVLALAAGGVSKIVSDKMRRKSLN